MRLQDDSARRYKGPWDVVTKTIKADGPFGLYKGVGAPMTGVGAVFAIYFLSFDSAERALRSSRGYHSHERVGFEGLGGWG